MAVATAVTLLTSIVTSVYKNKLSQDVFALLNTQQILAHMMLLACSATAPSNIYWYNQRISEYIQKDMYPTDEIYEEYFNFTESESPIDQLEDLGYEGANFMSLTGSLLINLGLALMVLLR